MKTVKAYDFDKELTELQRKVRHLTDGNVEVFETNRYKEPVQLGVNWAGIDTVAPEKAIEFAQKMVEVAELAKNFKYNGYIVEW